MKKLGFTLIELSIVLVIIGLIVGGVLVGRDLISAAEIRGQISQIEKYQTAANTFRLKYGYLPGDIPDPAATSYGFKAPRTGASGQGDGNGTLDGMDGAAGMLYLGGSAGGSIEQTGGETGVFWRDLSEAQLIDASFNTAVVDSAYTGSANIPLYFPKAKIAGNYIMVYDLNGTNYFEMQPVFSTFTGNVIADAPTLSVQQAYNIDMKIDDGLPMSGRVVPYIFTGAKVYYVSGASGYDSGKLPGMAYAPLATNCYDNGGNAANTMNYSTQINSGNGKNCTLSFKF